MIRLESSLLSYFSGLFVNKMDSYHPIYTLWMKSTKMQIHNIIIGNNNTIGPLHLLHCAADSQITKRFHKECHV